MVQTPASELDSAKHQRRRVTIEDITAMGSWEPVEDLDVMYDEQW